MSLIPDIPDYQSSVSDFEFTLSYIQEWRLSILCSWDWIFNIPELNAEISRILLSAWHSSADGDPIDHELNRHDTRQGWKMLLPPYTCHWLSQEQFCKTLGKRLQWIELQILLNLCSIPISMACELCLRSGRCTPSLTPRDHVRRTKEDVNRNPTIDFSYIVAMPVMHGM